MLQIIKESSKFIKDKTNFNAEIGIILGTGLGGLVNEIEIVHSIPYKDIPHFPRSGVCSPHFLRDKSLAKKVI